MMCIHSPRTLKRDFQHIALSLAVALALGATNAHADDLMQIYQEARASDPSLAGAEATKLATDENVDQVRALLLPQIGANASYSRTTGGDNGTTIITDPNDPSGNGIPVPGYSRTQNFRSLGATLQQSVLDISKWTALKASRYTAKAGAATYDSAQQRLLVDVTRAYFNVLTAVDTLTFGVANEKALARQLEQAQQRFEVGLAAITDVNDAQAQHDQAVASVIKDQNDVDTARETVRQLTNREPGEFKRLRDSLPLDTPTPNDPAAWVAVALKHNPDLNSAAFQLDAANTNIETARAGHYPTINADLGYARSTQWGDTRFQGGGNGGFQSYAGDPKWGGSIGLTLNVPIFSGGFTQSRVRQAVYNRDFALDQLEFNRRQVEAATRNSFRTVIAGAAEVEATQAAVKSAQSSVEATQAGYDVGTRTIVDVLISQQTLLQAQSAHSAARHAFVLNQILLKQAAGVVEVQDLVAINALLD